MSRKFSLLNKKYNTWIYNDWRTSKCIFAGMLLVLIIILTTGVYYFNYPQVELNADTPAYLSVVNKILVRPYSLVDTWRLPSYPLEIVLIYFVAGMHNLVAVSIAQGMLFVVTTLEVYILSILLFRSTWIAFFIGLLVGTNLVLLSYIKPIMSEGLALWYVTTLALAITYFLRTLRIRHLWLVTFCLLLLIFTRPEWLYLPAPLFAYLLYAVIRQRKKYLSFVRHIVLSLLLIYTLVGTYIAANALVNHYPGMTAIENFNWMGKVLQYHMEDEVTPDQMAVSRQLDACIAKIDRDPYHVLPCVSALRSDDDVLAGEYGRSIILHHPVEFLGKSLPLFFTSLNSYFDADSARVHTSGPFDVPLGWLKNVHIALYSLNICFPLCAAIWVFLLCRKKTGSNLLVLLMGAIILIVTYAIILTTLGGYALRDYMRVHVTFDALLIITIWGSFFLGILFILQHLRTRNSAATSH